MKINILFIIFNLLITNSIAQIYQSTQVDKVAEPTGGKEIFDLFISANLRIPVKLASKGINQEVLIKAVIEKDGSSSQLEIVKGIDSLSNAEAKRVLSLFKLWKPAEIKNETVRQEVVITIAFDTGELLNYDSLSNSMIYYYERNGKPVSGKRISKYRIKIPVDDFGFVNGNILSQEKTGDGWNIKYSMILKKEEYWEKTGNSEKSDSLQAIHITVTEDRSNKLMYQVIDRKLDGEILSFSQFGGKDKPIIRKEYYLNGMLKSVKVSDKDLAKETSWYDNGQLASIIENPNHFPESDIKIFKDFRDRKGNQLVIDGNGQGEFVTEIYHDQIIYDRGPVKSGLKEGLWIGKLKDSTKVFEEFYESGKLVRGTSYMDNETVEYTELSVQPMYHGGFPEMYKFLQKNMKYPKQMAKQGISGRVYTSFVVCQDGTLCNYEIIKGVNKTLNDEALRVVGEMSGKWEAGWLRGKKVRVKYNLPINFDLN